MRSKTPLPSTTRYARVRVLQGGEAKTVLKLKIDLENRHNHQPTSLLPTAKRAEGDWEGRGDRSNPHADQSSQSG